MNNFSRFFRFLAACVLALVVQAGQATVCDPKCGGFVTTTTYLHTDLLGSPVAGTDATGQVVWKETYLPFGERLQAQGNRTGFTGKLQDADTGLQYFGAREYDPAIGRFLSQDPIGFVGSNPGSFNRYGYVNNNPTKYVDPDGQYLDLAVEVVSIGVGVGMGVYHAATGDWEAAKGDAIGVGVDVGLAIVPGVPGVVGLTRVGWKSADKVADVSDVANSAGSAGKTVLGHFPEYKNLAESIGARRFNIPESVWNKMSEAERWGANQKFLDRMISRGDDVILSTPLDKVRPGSYFAKELEYLGGKGYRPSADGSRLIRGD